MNISDIPAEFAPVSMARSWPEGLVIRAERPEDVDGLTVLQGLPKFREGTLRLPYPRRKDVEARVSQSSPDKVSLVGYLGEKLVAAAGFTRFAGRRGHAASLGMGVHDDYSGRGIGQAMLGELIEIAENWMNIHRLELTVFADNDPAVRLYQKLGFEIEGTLRDFAFRSGAFVDAYAMARLRE
ncbi:GNAT family N-acetyltransferase [Stappia sp. BW2]|uniref:GNAT family N-acetyltransferase n=1 Tax=Stappia sp. BW2 TaxID=2592622 RepID=UPI0011DED7DE|nr:GNAT family N-acetyltransferase [Stappia sp. BW2]TYC67154.1 GNAT family N-acetyltransferase [Stappia sp. BW2]